MDGNKEKRRQWDELMCAGQSNQDDATSNAKTLPCR
jgi:hypothetical protein